MKNDIQTALDRLFRARHELNHESEIGPEHFDDELDALAAATGFDRAGAVERWERELEAEAAELRKRYEGGRVLDTIAAALRATIPEGQTPFTFYRERPATLVGKDARGLWKDTER